MKIIKFFIFFVLFFPHFSLALGLIQISDTINISWPNSGSDHTITFTTTSLIPAFGKIVIRFDNNFNFPSGLDWTDFDLNIENNEKELAGSVNFTQSGVEISHSEKKITITLAGNLPIFPQSKVVIRIGHNAFYQTTGDRRIINPSQEGSYRIYFETFDNVLNSLDNGQVSVAIITPVSVGVIPYDLFPPFRYNGMPIGVLAYGTTQTFLSLYTHEPAICKYSTSPNVPYNLMPYTISSSFNTYHSMMIYNLESGMAYSFYIRCIDTANNANTDDFLISFTIQTYGESRPGPGPRGPGGGGAPYPPEIAEVFFEGWAYYLGDVIILKDGKIQETVKSDTAGKFQATILNLPKGVYTFGIKGKDSEGRESITYSLTMTLRPNTKNTISGIFLPPTIEISKNTISAPGETIKIFGQATPKSTVEVWVYPSKNKVSEMEIKKITALSDNFGKWTIDFNTNSLALGQTYEIKAKNYFKATEASDFSNILYLGVGKAPTLPFCLRADINKDKKVNLTDFSIMLYWWGSANEAADINMDGKVNLTDFSIMLYCWTG